MPLKSGLLALIAIPLLSACVVGQNLPMDYSAASVPVDEPYSVQVLVSDERSYVRNGDKDPWYIGKYRAGFGNPWDVTTENNVPLADLLAADLVDALSGEGFATPGRSADRTLAVRIDDWNFDGYQNGRFWYDIEVVVSSADGRELARQRFKDEKVISGTFWGGAKAGFEREMPGLYREVVARVVADEQVLGAIRGG